MQGDHAETELMQWPMRLLLQGLTARDETKVRRYLSLGQQRLKHAWQLVPDGDAEVVLVDGFELDTVRGMLDAPLVTLHLLDASLDAKATAWRAARPHQTLLATPLQYEALMVALEHAEARIGPATLRPGSLRGLSECPPVMATAGCRFKLRAWPPAGLLSDDKDSRRLASFLVAECLNIDTLARLSNVATDRCLAFIARMAGAQLLDVESDGDPTDRRGHARRAAPKAPGRLARWFQRLGSGR